MEWEWKWCYRNAFWVRSLSCINDAHAPEPHHYHNHRYHHHHDKHYYYYYSK